MAGCTFVFAQTGKFVCFVCLFVSDDMREIDILSWLAVCAFLFAQTGKLYSSLPPFAQLWINLNHICHICNHRCGHKHKFNLKHAQELNLKTFVIQNCDLKWCLMQSTPRINSTIFCNHLKSTKYVQKIIRSTVVFVLGQNMFGFLLWRYVALMGQMGYKESEWAASNAVHQNRCEYPIPPRNILAIHLIDKSHLKRMQIFDSIKEYFWK